MFRCALRASVLAAFLLSLGTAAEAQLFRSYLSKDGSDANPCTIGAPCRLLPAALAVTNPGGEVWMLDSANYNTASVTISKSVLIQAVPGVVGSLITPGGLAGALTTATEGVEITVRNVAFRPVGSATGGTGIGVHMPGGALLVVDRCTFTGLARGIQATAGVKVAVVESRFQSGTLGVYLEGSAAATVTRSVFVDLTHGVSLYTSVTGNASKADIMESTFQAVSHGVYAYGANGGNAMITLRTSLLSGGTTGGTATAAAQGYGSVVATHNTIAQMSGPALHAYAPGSHVMAVSNIIYTANAPFHNEGGFFQSGGNNNSYNAGGPIGSISTPLPL